MHITVQIVGLTRTITLDVESWITTEKLKNIVQEKLGISPNDQRYSFKGYCVFDGRTLADFNICESDTIYLFIANRGKYTL